jgi:hypothetical protein
LSYVSSVKVELKKLDHLSNTIAKTVIDASARELAVEVLRRSMVFLEQQVYTRPNAQVTSEKTSTTPEPTGAMMNSGYIRTFTGELPVGAKDEKAAMSSARSKNANVTFGQAPPGPHRLGQAQVLFAVEYALYVEMGTILGMVARPYLRPAADEVQQFAERFVIAKLKAAGFS